MTLGNYPTDCPVCKAEKGRPCVSLREGLPPRRVPPHRGRPRPDFQVGSWVKRETPSGLSIVCCRLGGYHVQRFEADGPAAAYYHSLAHDSTVAYVALYGADGHIVNSFCRSVVG